MEMPMTPGNELEGALRGHCEAGDYRAAATTLLGALGGDVIRFIHARFRDEQTSAEVFSEFAQDLWLGLPKFRFECSLRAWVFILARNAGNRYLQREVRKQRMQVPLSAVPELERQVRRIRTETLLGLSTPREQRLANLRAELSAEDQELLMLRVDRELEFSEIALVYLGDSRVDAEALVRESARLRQRFKTLKERLRKRWLELTAKAD